MHIDKAYHVLVRSVIQLIFSQHVHIQKLINLFHSFYYTHENRLLQVHLYIEIRKKKRSNDKSEKKPKTTESETTYKNTTKKS